MKKIVLVKQCRKCGIKKDYKNYYKKNSSSDGVQAWCKTCSSAHGKREEAKNYQQKYYADNKERVLIRQHKRKPYKRDYDIQRKYGLSSASYDLLIFKQDNRCAICKLYFDRSDFISTPHVDHNHLTGKVRGLLCPNCNHGLGKFKDNIDYLFSAVEYLRRG